VWSFLKNIINSDHKNILHKLKNIILKSEEQHDFQITYTITNNSENTHYKIKLSYDNTIETPSSFDVILIYVDVNKIPITTILYKKNFKTFEEALICFNNLYSIYKSHSKQQKEKNNV
jgi:hypothetical protein